MLPTFAVEEMVVPLMNHIAVLPLVSRQRMSLFPSPLKSPVSATVQFSGMFPSPVADEKCPLPINHMAVLPLVSRQRMSVVPSPSKSPVPTMDQFVGALPTDVVERMAEPSISQVATLPLVSRHKRSLPIVAVEVASTNNRPACRDVSNAFRYYHLTADTYEPNR